MGTSSKSSSDNPFAALDASSFPSVGGKKGKKQTAAVPERKSEPRSPSSQGEEPDSKIFLQAMEATVPLGQSKGRKQMAVAPSTGDTPEEFIQFQEEFRKKNPIKSTTQKKQEDHRAGEVPSPIAKTLAVEDNDDEGQAFLYAMKDIKPLSGKGRDIPLEPEPIPVTPPIAVNPLQDIVEGKVEFALNSTEEFVEGHVIGLDLMTVGKLQARQYSPEAHVDLHGLNSEQAFQHLVGFVRSSYHKGVRTALVVTGRGKNSPNGIPVLRYKVQQWLTQEPFRRVVLAFCTAKREDGGPGALYILLRKYRKNSGKVRWDAMPTDPDLFL